MKIEFGKKAQIIIALLLLIGAAGAIAEYGNDINIPGNFTGMNGIFSGDISVSGTVDGVDVSTIPGTYVAKAGDTTTGLIINTLGGAGGTVTKFSGGLTGDPSQGGQIQFENTAVGALNPNRFIRLTELGDLEIVNSAYGATIFGLANNGSFTTDLNSKKIGGIIYADQYATIQDAVNASSDGDEIFIPRGNYYLDQPIDLGGGYRKIQCEQSVFVGNAGGTKIYANVPMMAVLDMTGSYSSTVNDCLLDANGLAYNVIALNHTVSGSHQNEFNRNDFYNATFALINSSNSEDNEWHDNRFSAANSPYGMYIEDVGGVMNIYNGIFTGSGTTINELYMNCSGTDNCQLNLKDVVFTDAPSGHQIRVGGNIIASLTDMWMEAALNGSIYGDTPIRINIVGGFITGTAASTVSPITGAITSLTTIGTDIHGQSATYSIDAAITNFYDVGTIFTKPINKASITNYGIINKDQLEFGNTQELLMKKQYARIGVSDGIGATSYFTQDGDNAQIVRNAFNNGSGWFRVDDSKSVSLLTLASNGGMRLETAAAGSGAIGFTYRTTTWGAYSAAPPAGGAGDTYYDTDVNYYCYSTAAGTANWLDMATGLVACT